MFRILPVLALLLFVASCSECPSDRAPDGALSQTHAEYRSSVVSDPFYELDISLDAEAENYEGIATLSFEYLAAAEDGEENPAAAGPLTIDFGGGEVLSLKVDGADAAHEYNEHFITLPEGLLKRGTRHSVRIEYSHPYSRDGAGLYRAIDPEDGKAYLYTDFEPYDANRLFPHFDQPDLKARFVMRVTAPASWEVISVMMPAAEPQQQGASRVWDFPATEPMSSYAFALHAGEYVVWEDNRFRYPLRIFARASLSPHVRAWEWIQLTRQGFEFFEEFFGFPYPFKKYDQILVPDFSSGAMENIAAVTFNEAYVVKGTPTRYDRFRKTRVIFHEMAHMWFGNLTTMAWWNDLWLNESFASYAASLGMAEGTDFDEAWTQFFLSKRNAYDADQLVTTHPVAYKTDTTDDAFANFDSITYGKGASTLKQLHTLVTDEVFRAAMHDYMEVNAWGNTRLPDFLDAMQRASGKDFKPWAKDWLETSGVNSLGVSYQCQEGVIASLHLDQSSSSEGELLRGQSSTLSLYSLGSEGLIFESDLPFSFQGARTMLPKAQGLPCPAFAYPNGRDEAYVKMILSAADVDLLKERLGSIEDPLHRAMIWYDLWSMVVHAELALPDFLDVLAVNIGEEQDRNVISGLGRYFFGAFSYLRSIPQAAGHLEKYTERLEPLLWQLVIDSSGDTQRRWLSAYLDIASSEPALEHIADILEGRQKLGKKFEADQGLRWRMILKLSEFGYQEQERLVATESGADKSSEGQGRYLQAQVLAADAEERLSWLRRITDSQSDEFNLRQKNLIARVLSARLGRRQMTDSHAEKLFTHIKDAVHQHGQNQGFHRRVTQYLVPRLCTQANAEELRQFEKRIAEEAGPVLSRRLRATAQAEERCAAIGELL